MDKRIKDFIGSQTVATICCTDEYMIPYCFSCFYAHDHENQVICFKSSQDAHHINLMNDGTMIAGTINPDKLNKLAIRGIQFRGMYLTNDEELHQQASSIYYSRFPFARAMQGEVYVIRLLSVKMTDNTLSFGKKLTWVEETSPVI